MTLPPESAPNTVMDPELFAVYIERRLSLNDNEIQLIDRDGMELRLLVRELEVTVDLNTYYRAYVQKPTQIDAVSQTLVRVLLGEMPTETETDFESLADRVSLMLKPIELLVEVRERNLPMLVYREFLANLIIVYTIDEERSVAFINEDHLDRWGIGEQDLHARALVNLQRQTTEARFTTTGHGEQRIFVFSTGDGYDATRLLLTDMLTQWARVVPGHLVIGIPNRDFLIAFSDADPDILGAIAHQVQVDSVQQAYGLTDQLFTLEKGQVREYEWE
ncbi:MAG: DUF1444 family protein [Roseiflexaceae bacterium]|nr:DUF1444 family protein [Roseiflexaceae bacterium]